MLKKKKKRFPVKSTFSKSASADVSIEAQLANKLMVISHYDGYRRGRAGDAPLIMLVGRNGVVLRPELSPKSLCFNSKHRTREPLDKF